MRHLKYHEQKLLKKVNFLEWKTTNTTREQLVTSKYLLKSREEYKHYNMIVGMIRKLSESLAKLADNDTTKMFIGKKLINLLYSIGIIADRKLVDCAKVTVSSICKRRLAIVMCHKNMIEGYANADKFVQQGHAKVGTRVITNTSTLISRAMEDFIKWDESSKIRKKIDEVNDEYDDYKY